MFKNYLNTALRYLRINKSYTLLNILGLSVGLGASMLLLIVVKSETSFDDFHRKKDSIYRIVSEFQSEEGIIYSPSVSFPVATQLRLDLPQLEEVASIFNKGRGQINVQNDVTHEEEKLYENNIFFAEPEFFKMFDFEWLVGNAASSLSEPNTVVLTKNMAEKYFGDWRSALGKSIRHDNKYTYKVTGVLQNTPGYTDFPLGVVVSYATLKNTDFADALSDWVGTYNDAYTFVVLPTSLSQNGFNSELKSFAKKHKPAENGDDIFSAQPLNEMHYDERFGNFRNHTFSHQLVNTLLLIGLFLLAIACINFINLATAQAARRSKEVGIRKVLGSNRLQLILQFLIETLLITVTASLIAILITAIALPILNNLLETKMTMNFIKNPELIVWAVIINILVTLFSGLYNAIIISRFKTVTALKSKITSKTIGGFSLRRVFIVLQFVVVQVLIIAMLIVVSQMKYFNNTSLGFDKASIITVPIPNDSIGLSKIDYLRDNLLNNSDIKDLSFSFASPSSDNNWTSSFRFNQSAKPTDFSPNLKWADADYFKTYNIEFVAGRPYYKSDTIREFVVNETLLAKLGIRNADDAIGKTINFSDNGPGSPIVGVVRDFNALSLKQPMTPVVLSTWKDVYQIINIKIMPGTEKRAIEYVEKLWDEAFPNNVYEYKFLDETIGSFYKQENQLSLLYKIFAGIAVLISCLGLYGLVSFIIVQRTKEVGIRKVLGAKSFNIIYLLSKEFTALIFIASTISVPFAYYIMNRWLQNYAYHIPLTVTIFMLAIISSILIAWITVGYRSIQAAVANPVKSLRTE